LSVIFTSRRRRPIIPSVPAAKLHQVLSRVVVAALVCQFYAAGLFAFHVASNRLHAIIGWFLVPACLLLYLLAIIGRRAVLSIKSSGALFVLAVTQPALAFIPQGGFRPLAGLHPLTGAAMLLLAITFVGSTRCPQATRAT
jgi:hypothetical protein